MIKQKRILFFAILSVAIVATVAMGWLRYNQVKPVSLDKSTNTTPIVTFDDQTANTSSRPTMTEEAKKQADAPGTKQPTIDIPHTESDSPAPKPITNAPKQDEIRDSVEEEYMYYQDLLYHLRR